MAGTSPAVTVWEAGVYSNPLIPAQAGIQGDT